MIRRAIGLGIFVVVMQFLAPSVWSAIETTIVSMLSAVERVASEATLALPQAALPKTPAR